MKRIFDPSICVMCGEPREQDYKSAGVTANFSTKVPDGSHCTNCGLKYATSLPGEVRADMSNLQRAAEAYETIRKANRDKKEWRINLGRIDLSKERREARAEVEQLKAQINAAHNQWTMNCVLFGAETFKRLSRGEISKVEALEGIKELSSEITDEVAAYLLVRINDIIDPI